MKISKVKIFFVAITTLVLMGIFIMIYLPQKQIVKSYKNIITLGEIGDLSRYKGKWVTVEYEYGFSAFIGEGRLLSLSPERTYDYFKCVGKDEFYLCSSPDFFDIKIEGKNYRGLKSKEKAEGEEGTYQITGYVSSVRQEIKSGLLEQIKKMQLINQPEKTQMDYVIEMLDIDTEKNRLSKIIKLLISVFLVWIFSIFLLFKEKIRDEIINRQKKKYLSEINTDAEETKKIPRMYGDKVE